MVNDKGPKREKWTVMVYMAGDNSLSEEMVYAIKEMYRVGVTDYLDVAIQFDPSGIGFPAKRYIISTIADRKRGLNPKIVSKFDRDGIDELGSPVEITTQLTQKSSDPVPQLQLGKSIRDAVGLSPEASADPRVLKDFVNTILRDKDRRADRYMVVLSGHGSGAIGDFLTDRNSTKGSRNPPSSSLGIPSLGWVFREVTRTAKRKIDIVGMDSCLMSMAEVCYELRKTAKYLVGSEGFAFATGWPYHRILKTLGHAPDKSTVPVRVVQDYINYYKDYEVIGSSTDQSACNLESFDRRLLPAIRNLAARLEAGLIYRAVKDGILLAHWEAQSYKDEQYVDLYDFCDRMQIRCAREQGILETFSGQDVTLEMLQRQLDPGLLEAVKALKENNDVMTVWQFLYDQLDSNEKETIEALKAVQEKQDLSAVRQLLIRRGQSSSKQEKALRSLQKRGDTKDNRNLLYERVALKENQVKLIEDLQSLLKEQSVPRAWMMLLEYSQAKSLVQALQQENNLGAVWQAIANELKELCKACCAVMDAIEGGSDRVILKSSYSGPDFQHSHGLSLFFPWSEEPGVMNLYENLGFAKDTVRLKGKDEGTGWAKFLRRYLQATRRERRNQKDHLGETPLRAGPPVNPLVSILAPLVSSVRVEDISSRGSSFGGRSMKNPPDGFYRDDRTKADR